MSNEPDQSNEIQPIKGIIVVDKPLNLTSMNVCSIVRGRLKAGGAPKRVKVGHGGTLDPLATGVLVVLIGKATKMCDEVMAGVKGYLTTVDLSQVSTTDDLEGEKTEIVPPSIPTLGEIEHACAKWTGDVMQKPPPYSAIKVNGQRAYALARKGEMVDLEARPVRIDSIKVVSYEWPMLTIDVVCGKGTYIRSLGRDIGAELGAGGMLTALRRTRVGQFTLAQAVTLDDVPNPFDPATVTMDMD
ncbi:MAG: tRNA pseudouridine(55) synthase TruB [Phycisphaerales bacterium]|nr:tRNA pseudouridine(55) synthase TruB [Phycisphaerales bacterium]